MFKLVKYALCAGLVTGGATIAAASDLPPEILDDVMKVCRPDYHNVCSYVLPGDGRVGRCLLDHERDLSPGCLKAVKFAYAIEVCLPDYRRFCNGVAPGGGRIVQCLADRIEALSPECGRVVSANAPYIYGDDRRYSDYRGPRSYSYDLYAERHRSYYPDHPVYEDRDRESDHDRYDDHQSYRDDRYADRGYYFDDHRSADEHREEYEEREPIK